MRDHESAFHKVLSKAGGDLPGERWGALRDFSELPALFEGEKTLYIKKPVRCGQVIEHSGGVVLLDNLNPGGYIKCGGPVIVMGDCTGAIWAGASGDKKVFVYAAFFRPITLKIASSAITLSDIPERFHNQRVICSIHENEIALQEYPLRELTRGSVSVAR